MHNSEVLKTESGGMSFSIDFKFFDMSLRKTLLPERIAKDSGKENTHIQSGFCTVVLTVLTLPAGMIQWVKVSI